MVKKSRGPELKRYEVKQKKLHSEFARLASDENTTIEQLEDLHQRNTKNERLLWKARTRQPISPKRLPTIEEGDEAALEGWQKRPPPNRPPPTPPKDNLLVGVSKTDESKEAISKPAAGYGNQLLHTFKTALQKLSVHNTPTTPPSKKR